MNNETEVIAYHQRHSRSLKNASTASHVSTGFVGLYIRVSTVDQGERYSPASQLKRLREKAAREGKQVRDEDIFIDYHTGKQESRPGFDRLKERVKSGAIDSVYVYDVSRFARRTLDALKVWSEFRKHGVSLEFYETPFEDTPAGRFAFTQMAAVAEFMGAKIVEDSKRGSLEKLQRGQLTHGSAPYGYKYVDKRDPQNPSSFQINENQAPIAREIFERRVQKWRKYSIARELNNRGIPAAKGGPWNYGSISQMRHNPTYMGTHVREGIIVPCPAIVSPELWSACQQVQDECRRAHVGRPPKRFLLVGYLWCGRCGHRCATVQDGKEYRAYRCHNVTTNKPPIHRNCPASGVKAALIEERAWNSIWQLLTDPKRLLEIARDYFESLKTPDHNSVEALRQEAAKLHTRIKRTQQMVRDAILDYDEGSAAIRTDKQRLEEIDRELRRAGRVIQLPSLAQAEAAVAEYRDLSPSSFEARRDILESILDLKMRYADGNLEITGRVPTLSNSTHGVGQQIQ